MNRPFSWKPGSARMRSRISTSLTVMPCLRDFGDHRFFVDQLLQDLPIDAELLSSCSFIWPP